MSFFTFLRGRLRYCGTLLLGQRGIHLTNQTPVISFTFDDFPRSALKSGGSILEKYGLAATYYAALGLMNAEAPVGRIFSEEDLHEVLIRGHELGCHTFDHCHAWKTHPRTFEESILRNRRTLSRLLPGASFPTHSYPLDIPRPRTKHKTEKYFLCCRGGSQTLNYGRTDLNYLKAYFLERSSGNSTVVKALIDWNCRRGGWLIFGTHDITQNPSPFGCTPGFFTDIVRYAVRSGATILPVAAALKKLQEPGVSPGELAGDGDGLPWRPRLVTADRQKWINSWCRPSDAGLLYRHPCANSAPSSQFTCLSLVSPRKETNDKNPGW